MYWEPWQPSSGAETTLYFLDPGYFGAVTQIAQAVQITLDAPPNNAVTNDANITFTHTATSNGTIDSCNLLVYYDATLTINDTIAYPGQGTYNWTGYPLPEDEYTWRVACTSGGETSTSSTYNLAVDRTAPDVTIIQPLNSTTPWEAFEFDINEPYPDYLVITMNGTNYTFNYTNGTNSYTPTLPEGIFEWNITVYDQAGNNVTLTNNPIYVIDVPVTFNNIMFSPNPPWDDQDNQLSVSINGGFTTVVLSINVNGTGWTNYTITSFTGSGPYTYYYDLDETMYEAGDWIAQQWFALDNIPEWQSSNILNVTVKKRTGGGGGGGSFEQPPTGPGALPDRLYITPEPLQINNLQGTLFDVVNNGTEACKITNIDVEDRMGSTELQDAFTTKTLSLEQDLTLEPGERLGFQLKPRSFQGIAGVGAVIVTSEDCETTEADLGVDIHWIDITIDVINDFTDNVISWINGIVRTL
jgi:hypothetical protein